MTGSLLLGALTATVVALDHIGGAMPGDVGDGYYVDPCIEEIGDRRTPQVVGCEGIDMVLVALRASRL